MSRDDVARFHDILDARAINVLYQPIVALDTGRPVGYEALARGPAGTPFVDPTRLFATGYHTGRVGELDCVCRAAAYRGALAAGLDSGVPLFVNAEPVSLGTRCPGDLHDIIEQGQRRLRVVLELTERWLANDPAGLMRAVDTARGNSMGVALDDVGADPGSLAMMPLLRPDLIKLDLRLVQGRPTPLIARISNAALAEAERSGATIVAEGIETRQHALTARAMGATLGQGWLYGRPGPLPEGVHPDGTPLSFGTPPVCRWRTPYQVLAGRRPVARVDKELLEQLSMQLEYKGFDLAEPAVILSSFQDVRHFTPHLRDRYTRLAARGGLVAALGVDMPVEPAPGVRGGRVGPGDPLREEWAVVVIGPHFAVAMAARDLGDVTAERRRRFDLVLTHDRALAIEAGQALVHRLHALPPGHPDLDEAGAWFR